MSNPEASGDSLGGVVTRRNVLTGLGVLGVGGAVGVAASKAGEGPLEGKCPFCGRTEQVDHREAGHAWIVGHIDVEHREKIPDYEGTA